MRRDQSLRKTILVFETNFETKGIGEYAYQQEGEGAYKRRVFTRYLLLNTYLVANIEHDVDNGLVYATVFECLVEKFE